LAKTRLFQHRLLYRRESRAQIGRRSAMEKPDVNVYFVGFMGTGKTTVARALAYRLGFEWFDVDERIERARGKTVAQIFAEDGEPAFRAMEREFIEGGLPEKRAAVSCGGGLVVQPGMLDLLKTRGVVICLHASIETILRRTQHGTARPLLNVADPLARIRALYAEREPVYRRAGTLVLTDNRSLPEIIAHAMRVYLRDAREFSCAQP
jgi:shikimate kinase